MFPLVGVDNPVKAEVPHLYISVSRASAEHGLVLVHAQTLDGVVVGLNNRQSAQLQRFLTSFTLKVWSSLACLTSQIQICPFFPAEMRRWCWLAWTKAEAPASWELKQAENRYLSQRWWGGRGGSFSWPVGLDTGLPGGQECIPQCHVPPVLTVTRSCQQGGAASLEDEVCRVPVVGLQVEEGRGGVGCLEKCSQLRERKGY